MDLCELNRFPFQLHWPWGMMSLGGTWMLFRSQHTHTHINYSWLSSAGSTMSVLLPSSYITIPLFSWILNRQRPFGAFWFLGLTMWGVYHNVRRCQNKWHWRVSAMSNLFILTVGLNVYIPFNGYYCTFTLFPWVHLYCWILFLYGAKCIPILLRPNI